LRAAREALASVEYAVDAIDQPLQCGAVDLVGATEIVHHAASGRLASAFQTLSASAC
jgi:hypothetical protein